MQKFDVGAANALLVLPCRLHPRYLQPRNTIVIIVNFSETQQLIVGMLLALSQQVCTISVTTFEDICLSSSRERIPDHTHCSAIIDTSYLKTSTILAGSCVMPALRGHPFGTQRSQTKFHRHPIIATFLCSPLPPFLRQHDGIPPGRGAWTADIRAPRGSLALQSCH